MGRLRERLVRPFAEFVQAEATSGILLMIVALAALIWANSPGERGYFQIWQQFLTIGYGNFVLDKPIILWINDGLMAVFFFLVGLEIKREILVGELAEMRKAALPIFAALGGMAVPAAIYVFVNLGQPGVRGWGVPMATDIAFALGVLNLLGSRVPLALKVFLAAVAIVDDLGSVIVIAVFYSESIQWGALAGGLAIIGGLLVLNRVGVRSAWAYLLPGLGVWVLFLKSGIHPTIAGVLVAMTIPARAPEGQTSTLQRVEHALQPVVSYLIVPLFALANAGVSFSTGVREALGDKVGLGIAAGLLVGKPVGILGASYLAIKAGFASLPDRVGWRQMAGVGMVAGIGFTMSLFVSDLAYPDAGHLTIAKVSILCSSLVAGVVGFVILRRGRSRRLVGAAE